MRQDIKRLCISIIIGFLSLTMAQASAMSMPALKLAHISALAQANDDHITSLFPRSWEKMTTEEVFDYGFELNLRNQRDSAYLAFSFVLNRYTPNSNKEATIMAVKAHCNRAIMLYQLFYDPNKTIPDFTSALELCDQYQLSDTKSMVYLLLVDIFRSKVLTTTDPEIINEWQRLCKEALKVVAAEKVKDNFLIFYEVATSMWAQNPKFVSQEIIDLYYSTPLPTNTLLYDYCKLRTQAIEEANKKNYSGAIELLNKQLEKINDDVGKNQLSVQTLQDISRMQEALNQYPEALTTLKKAQDIIDTNEITDLKRDNLTLYAKILEKMGNYAEANNTYHRIQAISDSISKLALTENSILDIATRLSNLDNQLETHRANADSSRRHWLVALIITICLVLAVAFLLIYNRRLNQKNLILYDRLQAQKAAPAPSLPKYTTMALDQQEKELLWQKIQEFQNSPDQEWLNPDFRLADLAKALDSKPNYVSMVINDLGGVSFNAWLNHIRIMEACRRIDTPEEWGSYTLEHIGSSVGFNSRATFGAAFKSETGMTPAQYRRIALQKTVAT